MNTTRSTSAKIFRTIGGAAAYGFWITSALAVLGFIAVLFTFDTPAAYQIGQGLAIVGFAMIFSILVLVSCFSSLSPEDR